MCGTLWFQIMILEDQKTAQLEVCAICDEPIERGGGFQCLSCHEWYHVRCAGYKTLPNCNYCARYALPPGGM